MLQALKKNQTLYITLKNISYLINRQKHMHAELC